MVTRYIGPLVGTLPPRNYMMAAYFTVILSTRPVELSEHFNSFTLHLLEVSTSKWMKMVRRHSISRQDSWTSESAHIILGHCITINIHPVHPISYQSTLHTKKCVKSTDACLPTEANLLKLILNSQSEALQPVERHLGQST
jgi:hypothetical protein